jgi:ubiquinone/menaquinone biosynthesis C-methylase UbiE
MSVFEAGCGRGEDLVSLSMARSFLIGLDYSTNSLKICKSKKRANCACDFILGDILHLPFRDNVFDMVFNAGVVEHFRNHFAPLREMVRVTGTGKSVVVFVPNMFSWWVTCKHLVNMLSKLTNKTKGWGVWEKSFNWFSLKKSGEFLGLESVRVEGIHLLHYYYIVIVLEQLARIKLPKGLTYHIMSFFGRLDVKPTALSKCFGMELVLIGRKP